MANCFSLKCNNDIQIFGFYAREDRQIEKMNGKMVNFSLRLMHKIQKYI